MFVRHMTADEWLGRVDHGITLVEPTWEQLRQAILALDGMQKTMVILSDREASDSYMIIAGQWGGRFLVNVTKDNNDFYSLIDMARSSKKMILQIGGQDGDYAENKCVPLAWALEAAETFFETGELTPSMSWSSDYRNGVRD